MEEPEPEADATVKKLEFVRFREVKAQHSGHRAYKFFLVDSDGKEHLAATAEETADAHYNYESVQSPEFQGYGGVKGHSRKDLTLWLEQVIKESGLAARGDVLDADHVVHLGQPTSADPLGTYFVNFRQERTHLPDGRRCNQWWLVDQHGVEHLAVVGTERETRDAHYTYHQTEKFTDHPLECNNQGKVLKWIEAMLTHHCPPGVQLNLAEAGGGAGAATPSGAADDAAPQNQQNGPLPSTSEGDARPGAGGRSSWLARPTAAASASASGTTPLEPQAAPTLGKPPRPAGTASRLGRPPGSGRGGGPRQSGSKHKLVGVAQDAHLKRLRRLAAESEEAIRAAQAAHLVRLRRAAEAEAAATEAVRRSAAHWVRDLPGEDEEGVINQWLDTLKQLLKEARRGELQQVPCNMLDLDLNQLLDKATHVELQQQQQQAAGAADASAPAGVASAAAGQPDLPPGPLPAAASDSQQEQPLPAQRSSGGGAASPAPPAIHSHSELVSTWTYADPHLNRHGVRLALEGLREVAALMLPLQAMLSSDLIDTVRAYADEHPHPLVSRLAQHVLGVWQRAVLTHLRALVSPSHDPVAALEARVLAGQIFTQEVPASPTLTPATGLTSPGAEVDLSAALALMYANTAPNTPLLLGSQLPSANASQPNTGSLLPLPGLALSPLPTQNQSGGNVFAPFIGSPLMLGQGLGLDLSTAPTPAQASAPAQQAPSFPAPTTTTTSGGAAPVEDGRVTPSVCASSTNII